MFLDIVLDIQYLVRLKIDFKGIHFSFQVVKLGEILMVVAIVGSICGSTSGKGDGGGEKGGGGKEEW